MQTQLIEVLEIQNKIYKLFHSNNGVSVHFRWSDNKLSLITYNPKNNEFFLVRTIQSEYMHDKERELVAHELMLEYVEDLIKSIDKKTNKLENYSCQSYTVIWSRENEKINTSYFYANDIEDLLKKFYFGKEAFKNLFNILEIKQNPIS
jgi:hypothetical protein